jgi:hypothetical protein
VASVKTAVLVIMSMPFVGAAIAAGATSSLAPVGISGRAGPGATAPQKSGELGPADNTAISGIQSRVGYVYDCDSKTHAPPIFARADHGSVVVREVDDSACNDKSMKVAGIFYKSDRGFVGEDTVYIIGYSTEESIDSTLHVQVSKKKYHASAQKDRVPKQ